MIKTNKIIEREIPRKVFLYEVILDIDEKYFINQIESCLKEQNLYYKTNVKGQMTSWNAFNENEKFLNVIKEGSTYIQKYKEFPRLSLESAWGLKIEKGDYTHRHNHAECTLSGILYLNDINQDLIFPDLKISVTPQKGSFLMFSSWLDHMANINHNDFAKYAIAFNFQEHKDKTWS